MSLELHTPELLQTHVKVEYQRNAADSGSHGNERRHFVSHLYKRYVITLLSSNCLLALNFNFFSISQILFHLSFTVLVHYQASKLLGLESGFSLFKQRTTCAILLFSKVHEYTVLSKLSGEMLRQMRKIFRHWYVCLFACLCMRATSVAICCPLEKHLISILILYM